MTAVPAAAQGDLSALRATVEHYYTAAGADPADPFVASALETLETLATQYSGAMLPDGSWGDLAYAEIPSTNWSPEQHVVRLLKMATAYNTPGQSLYNSAALLNQLELGLLYMQTFYSATRCTSTGNSTILQPGCGNWYQWVIGVPLKLGRLLVLMQGDLSSSIFDQAAASIAAHIGTKPQLTGANLLWSAQNHLYYALILNDSARMNLVKSAVITTLKLTIADGIQKDFSFQQHGALLYTGGYGASFADFAAAYAGWTQGTIYQVDATSFTNLTNYVYDGTAWTVFGPQYDVSVLGREVTRPGKTAGPALNALLNMSLITSSKQALIISAARQMLQSWALPLPVEIAGLAARVSPLTPTAMWPSGHKHYAESDHTVHRRPNYYASIKMLSKRMVAGELAVGEGKLGSRQSDGRLYLSLTSDEYYKNNVWPTMDWSRLPGITVEQKAGIANSTYGYGQKTFVGGTTDGQNGVSAMDYAPNGSLLRAKKSWFFFNDSIVFLTSGITLPNANHAETIIQQWPLSSPSSPLYIDGVEAASTMGWSQTVSAPQWAYADNIGYHFLDGNDVVAKRLNQSGSWSKLGAGPTTSYTNPFLTLLQDHGAYTAGANSAYAIVPGLASVTDMETWVAGGNIKVLQNDTVGSAVKHEAQNSTGIVFWVAGTVAGVTSNYPAVAYIGQSESDLTISAADPAQNTGVFRLTLPGYYRKTAGSASVVGSFGSEVTSFDFPRAGGVTSTVTLTPTTPPPPPVIVDNEAVGISGGGASYTGTWCASTLVAYGSPSLSSCGAGTETYRWTPDLASTGNYEVYIWYPASTSQSTAVKVTINHADGIATGTVNMQLTGSQWKKLVFPSTGTGIYRMVSGTTNYVEIRTDLKAIGSADAVKFVPVP